MLITWKRYRALLDNLRAVEHERDRIAEDYERAMRQVSAHEATIDALRRRIAEQNEEVCAWMTYADEPPRILQLNDVTEGKRDE